MPSALWRRPGTFSRNGNRKPMRRTRAKRSNPVFYAACGLAIFPQARDDFMADTQVKPLLDPQFLARLEQLELVSGKILMGRMKGERRSKKKGQSVEFADYRNYVIGDDLRHLDWNLFGRLDKLFIRLFMEEEDLHFYVLIDNSLSMDFGNPTKLLYAKQVAAALGFIGLVNLDRVVIEAF